MTFADLLAFLVGFAPSLASRDILSVDALRHIPETTLVQISPTRPDLDKMLAALVMKLDIASFSVCVCVCALVFARTVLRMRS